MSEDRADYNPTAGMMSLKGKEYLPVAQRIVWFRHDYPEGTIETTIREIDRETGFAMFTAEVCTGQGGRATATGTETAKDFGDFIEKAETKAIGRALGYLGYGTASAGFEEGSRIVDSPVQRPQTAPPARTAPQAPSVPRPAVAQVAAGPSTTPLTEEQERVIVQVREMAEANETYGAAKALVQTLQVAATDEQWTEIKRRWFKVRQRHYPLTINQVAEQAG